MWLSTPFFHREDENQKNACLCLGCGTRRRIWGRQPSCRQPGFSPLVSRRVIISARNEISPGTWGVSRGHEQGANSSGVPKPASLAPRANANFRNFGSRLASLRYLEISRGGSICTIEPQKLTKQGLFTPGVLAVKHLPAHHQLTYFRHKILLDFYLNRAILFN